MRMPSEHASSTIETAIALWRLPLFDLAEDVHRAGLGLERPVARDHMITLPNSLSARG